VCAHYQDPNQSPCTKMITQLNQPTAHLQMRFQMLPIPD
jgi:hypothetical protein